MAKTPIQGKDFAFLVEKPAGSGTFVRVSCVADVSLSINTASDDVDCVDSANFAESVPGQMDWGADANLTARTIDGTDADTNITVDEFIALQFLQTIFKVRFTLGTKRYGGNAYISKSAPKGQTKGAATAAISIKGTGPLALVPTT